MTTRIVLVLVALAGSTACREAPRTESAVPEDPGRRVLGTFTGEVDPATGVIRILPSGPAALRVVPDVSDDVPGSGPPDTVEVVNDGIPGVVAGRCGATPAFEGSVRIRSFFTDRTLSNVHAEITDIVPSGRESCRSAQPVLGTSIASGLFSYPSLTAAGTPRASAAVTWSFRLPDMAPFTFHGRVLADVLEPCDGAVNFGVLLDEGGSGGRVVEAADFDGDGRLDLAMLWGNGSPGLTIRTGLGNGHFAPAYSLAGGADMAVADVTGDGRPDLLVGNSGNVNVYTNLGDVLSSTAVVVPTGVTSVTALAVGDLTGDGRPDLAVVDYSGSAVRTFANTGADDAVEFTARSSQTLSGRPRDVAIAELSGDGDGDVVLVQENAPNALAILLGAGDGSVLAPTYHSTGNVQPYAVRTADLDGDGRTDVFVMHSVYFAFYRNLGAGPHPAPVQLAAPVSSAQLGNMGDIRFGDLDGDGSLDVVVAVSSSLSLGVLLNDGAGGLQPAVRYPSGLSASPYAYGLALGDWDGDERLDAVVSYEASPYTYTYLGRGDGTFFAPVDVGLGAKPQRVLAGDLDRDGDEDLVTINYNIGTVSILQQGPDGAFTSSSLWLGGASAFPWEGVLADVNGDGDPDLIVVHLSANQVSVLPGLGNGSFGARTTYAVSAIPQGIAVGDLDGDLDLDAVIVSSTGSRLDFLLGHGDGTFTPGTPIVLPAQGFNVAVGDLDGDAIADLAVAHGSPGVSVYRGTGGGTFAAPASYPAITGFRLLLADLTNDGRPDLVSVRSNTPYGVGISINTGAGAFGPATAYEAGADPYSVTAADLDADGSLDLAVPDYGSIHGYALSTLRNAGDGTFEAARAWHVRQGPRSVAALDVGGDGRMDLAVANAYSDSVSILRGTCR